MKPIAAQRTIAAPKDQVFGVVADVRKFKEAVPGIVSVEFLSAQQEGVGTRFRETRLMGKREAATTLEVTEFVPGDRVRMVADAGGTVWDTVFTVRAVGGQTTLDMVMEARPHKFLARLMNPLIRGVVAKAVEGDMEAVKQYCEEPST